MMLKKTLIRWLVYRITPFLRFITNNTELWHYVESQGYHVTPVHFYQPIPDTAQLRQHYPEPTSAMGIDWRKPEQLKFLQDVCPQYAEEYNKFDADYTRDDRFYMDNTQFIANDPHIYYCMIRHYQPKKVVEVGAGFSTLVASQAALCNPDTQVIAIEPYPRDFVKNQVNGIQHINQSAQNMDISYFEQLEANDILFIDSSHVVKTGSDVVYLVLEVLPRLAEGVIVHFHDIFLPFEYPKDWLFKRRLFWNEQYLVQAFLMNNSRVKILYANRYMTEYYKDEYKTIFPKALKWGGGSLWLRM